MIVHILWYLWYLWLVHNQRSMYHWPPLMCTYTGTNNPSYIIRLNDNRLAVDYCFVYEKCDIVFLCISKIYNCFSCTCTQLIVCISNHCLRTSSNYAVALEAFRSEAQMGAHTLTKSYYTGSHSKTTRTGYRYVWLQMLRTFSWKRCIYRQKYFIQLIKLRMFHLGTLQDSVTEWCVSHFPTLLMGHVIPKQLFCNAHSSEIRH